MGRREGGQGGGQPRFVYFRDARYTHTHTHTYPKTPPPPAPAARGHGAAAARPSAATRPPMPPSLGGGRTQVDGARDPLSGQSIHHIRPRWTHPPIDAHRTHAHNNTPPPPITRRRQVSRGGRRGARAPVDQPCTRPATLLPRSSEEPDAVAGSVLFCSIARVGSVDAKGGGEAFITLTTFSFLPKHTTSKTKSSSFT